MKVPLKFPAKCCSDCTIRSFMKSGSLFVGQRTVATASKDYARFAYQISRARFTTRTDDSHATPRRYW